MLLDYGLYIRTVLVALQLFGAYISGSSVLALRFPRTRFNPGDLDIYVPASMWLFLRFFLLSHRNLQLVEDLQDIGKKPYNRYYPLPQIEAIWYIRNRESGKIINVIVTSSECALPAIISFHSTIAMNFIAYFGMVVLYGEPTSQKVGWQNVVGPLSKRDQKWAEKYMRRGFTIFPDSNLPILLGRHTCGTSPICSQTIRSLFDDGVHVFKFPVCEAQDTKELLRTLTHRFFWRLNNRVCQDVHCGHAFIICGDAMTAPCT
ncbi:hypothetical protein BKA70DRAFT_1113306 [Coprinopsis sp. MPI-PUGE-AT-0042]|nr:hypothetical protein BKA70DRAFT_1113306 [Coprinopsis sp. MPI-PUGE-AT-0042]